MQNLKRFAKIILIIFLALIVVNLAVLIYAYTISTRAVKDTLSSVALIVAEDNCISNDKDDPGMETNVDTIKKLLVENSTVWLSYNTSGLSDEGNMIRSGDTAARSGLMHYNVRPTNIVQTDLRTAINNVDWSLDTVDANTYSAVKISLDGSNTNNANLYSYLTCKQRGTPVTIHLNAYMTYRFMTIFGTFDLHIPIHEEITVVGMKFYRGREA